MKRIKAKKIQPKVSIIMGSANDAKIMQKTEKILKELKVKFTTHIVSAHRTPKRMFNWAENLHKNYTVCIAAAGGSASLPSVTAALASIPVIGVPIETKKLHGLDSLLSLNCCPSGCPLATMPIGEAGAVNAALFAAEIIATFDDKIKFNLSKWKRKQTKSVKIKPK